MDQLNACSFRTEKFILTCTHITSESFTYTVVYNPVRYIRVGADQLYLDLVEDDEINFRFTALTGLTVVNRHVYVRTSDENGVDAILNFGVSSRPSFMQTMMNRYQMNQIEENFYPTQIESVDVSVKASLFQLIPVGNRNDVNLVPVYLMRYQVMYTPSNHIPDDTLVRIVRAKPMEIYRTLIIDLPDKIAGNINDSNFRQLSFRNMYSMDYTDNTIVMDAVLFVDRIDTARIEYLNTNRAIVSGDENELFHQKENAFDFHAAIDIIPYFFIVDDLLITVPLEFSINRMTKPNIERDMFDIRITSKIFVFDPDYYETLLGPEGEEPDNAVFCLPVPDDFGENYNQNVFRFFTPLYGENEDESAIRMICWYQMGAENAFAEFIENHPAFKDSDFSIVSATKDKVYVVFV